LKQVYYIDLYVNIFDTSIFRLKKYTASFIVLLFFLGIYSSAFSQSVPSIILKEANKEYNITSKIGLLEEKMGVKQSIEVIQKADFKVSEKELITLNNGLNVLWFKIPFQNNSTKTEWYLEVGDGLVDIEVFIPKENNSSSFEKINLGYSLPFKDRIIQTDRFIIPLNLPKNQETTIYLRLESNYFHAPIHIAPITYYLERDHNIDIAEGMYYGFVVVMFFYNFFIFLRLRERGYVYYVAYLVFFGLAMAQLRTHGFEFLWSDLPELNKYNPVLYSLSGIFAGLFLIDFLDTKKNSRFFHIILYVITVIFALGGLASIIGFKGIATFIIQAIGAVSTLNALAAAIFVYYKGYKPAKYIILAWTFYLLGVLLFVLAGASIIPYNSFTSSSILFGSAIEMVLLSVALADKIDFYKKKQAELQTQMYHKSEEHRKFIETQNKRLEERVVERTEELHVVNEELSVNLDRLNEQNIIIQQKNQDITASITYAKRIQQAMLPSLDEISSVFKNSFVFFKPRDIVSGDFYYFKQINKKVILGAIDCTGHGVPGAFMSLIGNDLLNEIVESKSVTRASHILDKLDEGIVKVLRQNDTQIRDGMDAAFCVYDMEEQTVEYAGAKNPLIYIQNGELKRIKGDKHSIGGNLIKNQTTHRPFLTHTIPIEDNTSFYLFSDGFQDQFGGDKDRKFTTKRFRETLLEASKLPFSEQENFLENTLKNWIGDNRQIDDILVIGFTISK